MPTLKLWQLYIVPFIIIAFILLYDESRVFVAQQLPFSSITKDTSALVEVDPSKMEKAHVTKIVDGDTIKIDTGATIRYVGIDTPETKHPKKSVQCFGREASQKNKELVDDRDIYMQKDISETDRYGRLLRYIYLPNPESSREALFINEYMIEQGYAHLLTYPPDVTYNDILRDAQTYARTQKKGLWDKCS